MLERSCSERTDPEWAGITLIACKIWRDTEPRDVHTPSSWSCCGCFCCWDGHVVGCPLLLCLMVLQLILLWLCLLLLLLEGVVAIEVSTVDGAESGGVIVFIVFWIIWNEDLMSNAFSRSIAVECVGSGIHVGVWGVGGPLPAIWVVWKGEE